MVMRSRVVGCGAYLPERVMTNHDIAQIVDTSDEWINTRTGIRQRHIAADGELTSDLAVRSADIALQRAGVRTGNVDLIILATTTPDETFPATATRVQSELGVDRGAAFDVQAVCAGFIYALAIADNFIRLGQAETALIIGSETFSRILDWTDRSTCVLFGDGAGALVLRATNGNGSLSDRGVLSTHLHSDGRLHDMLYVDGGPSSTQTSGRVRMEGQEVFRQAVLKLAQAVEEAIAANGVKPGDIDWLVPHQANKRIMGSTARKLGLPEEKVIVTIERHANTSAASIPLALAEGEADGRIQPGHLILLEALGGGLVWGSSLVRW